MNTTIREARNIAGRFRGGKLHPSMAVALKGGEGGMLTQTATIELDPVAGRLITPVTGEMLAVYVPVQAMVAMRDNTDGTDATAGITEVIRQKYLDGAPIFPLENENTVSKRMGIMPIKMGGVFKVSEAARLAHNCAVNFLRQSLYAYAVTVDKTNVAVTPALLSSTALDRFNAVLDPDQHIGGLVSLNLTGQLPVRGMGLGGTLNQSEPKDFRETGQTATTSQVQGWIAESTTATGKQQLIVERDVNGPAGYPNIRVNLDDVNTGFTLNDLANAETMDRLTRQMRDVIDANPVDGEEQVVRWAYGLQVDKLQTPFLLAKRSVVFGQEMLKAMDKAGVEAETTQSRLMQRLTFTVPVPQTELGGVIVTFLVVKPDEVLLEQPHPVLTQPWGFDNLAAQQLEIDPVPVLGREVQATVATQDENTVMFYTGFNELRRVYVNYGWNRDVDENTVDAKNAMWQYEIPASVTPENIIYPENLEHFPFVDQDAEIARYMLASTYVGKSPIFVGPSPVETVTVIESDDLFGDADE